MCYIIGNNLTKRTIMKNINIWSKGEVITFLNELAQKGQIKECKNLKVEKGSHRAFFSKCIKEWTSWEQSNNTYTDCTGYRAPSSYSWPKCPNDCPYFIKTKNFITSLNNEIKFNEKEISENQIKKELKYPTRITLRWLYDNVPIYYWFIFALFLFAVFKAGMIFEEIESLNQIRDFFKNIIK